MRPPADAFGPDASLVARFKQGDQEAFEQIVIRYRHEITRIAHRMTGDAGEADDIAQETFVRAHGALHRFRGESSLKTWLTRIALNLSINAGRARTDRRATERPLETAGEGALGQPPGAERRLLVRERDASVRRAVDALPPRQKQVVILRIYEEMPFQAIADLIESPIGTVKANFFHAVQNLKKALA